MFKCLKPDGFRDDQYLFKRNLKAHAKLFELMDSYAEEVGIQYDERITGANKTTAEILHEALKNKATWPSVAPLARAFVLASTVCQLGRTLHQQPENVEEINRLFNDPSTLLIMSDTPYVKAERNPIEIEWSFQAFEAEVKPKAEMPKKYVRERDDEEIENIF